MLKKDNAQDKALEALGPATRNEVEQGPQFARFKFLQASALKVSESDSELAAYLGGKATQVMCSSCLIQAKQPDAALRI